MDWHFRSTFFVFCFLFYIIGFKLNLLGLLIKNVPFPLVQLFGHGPKCIAMTMTVMINSLLAAVFVKYLFYRVVALVYGYESLYFSDDFYLYDLPVNPINIPGYLVFKKEKGKQYDWDKIMETVFGRYSKEPSSRNFMKIEKKFGKYFLKT